LAARTRRASKSAGSLSQRGGVPPPHDIVKPPPRNEELTVTIEGVRVVLLGDVHELPILDMSVKNFTATQKTGRRI
jgi:vacuolar protein sorting-associated protein 13A/C